MREKEEHFYAFGTFVLDTAQQVVLRQGVLVPLTPKTYETLLALVKNSGRVIPKAELMKALWPDSFVEEANLTQQISVIRKALGEAPGTDPYIVTVTGKGYRFAAEVKEWAAEGNPVISEPMLSEESTPLPVPLPNAAEAETSFFRWRRKPFLFALVFVAVALAALGYFAYQKRLAETRSGKTPRSLAILPFQGFRQDASSEFLGFSLADAIRDAREKTRFCRQCFSLAETELSDLKWSEVTKSLDPSLFTLKSAPERFLRVEDPLRKVLDLEPDLPRVLGLLDQELKRRA